MLASRRSSGFVFALLVLTFFSISFSQKKEANFDLHYGPILLSKTDTINLDDYLLVSEQENILRYKQGGLCLYYDCKIDPRNAFVAIIWPGKNSTMYKESPSPHTTIVSKYDDSTYIYQYKNAIGIFFDAIYLPKLSKKTDNIDIFPIVLNSLDSEVVYMKTAKPIDSNFYEKYKSILNPIDSAVVEKYIYVENRHSCLSKMLLMGYNPAFHFCHISNKLDKVLKKEIFRTREDIVIVRKNDIFLESLIRKKGESLASLKHCNNSKCSIQNCPVESKNHTVKLDSCLIYADKTRAIVIDKKPCFFPPDSPLMSCQEWLSCAKKEYEILYHTGPFAGDCDLSNWRGIRLKDLSEYELEQLKKIYYWWEE